MPLRRCGRADRLRSYCRREGSFLGFIPQPLSQPTTESGEQLRWVYKIETGEVFAYDVGNGPFVKLAEYHHPEIETSARRRTTHII